MSEFKNNLGQPVGYSMADWQERPRPPRSPMTGQHCRVEILNADAHARSLYQAYAGEDDCNWTYLPYGPFHQFAEFDAWLRGICGGDDPLFHTIIDSETEKPVGIASYLRITPSVGVVEVGHIHFSPQIQQTTVGTESMFLMMSRVFDELGYRRYEWKCDALNERSRNAALRFGFAFEGIFRQASIYKGRSRDTAWYSIIDQDWPLLKEAYRQWLSPENHATGKQLQRLSTLIKRTQAEGR